MGGPETESAATFGATHRAASAGRDGATTGSHGRAETKGLSRRQKRKVGERTAQSQSADDFPNRPTLIDGSLPGALESLEADPQTGVRMQPDACVLAQDEETLDDGNTLANDDTFDEQWATRDKLPPAATSHRDGAEGELELETLTPPVAERALARSGKIERSRTGRRRRPDYPQTQNSIPDAVLADARVEHPTLPDRAALPEAEPVDEDRGEEESQRETEGGRLQWRSSLEDLDLQSEDDEPVEDTMSRRADTVPAGSLPAVPESPHQTAHERALSAEVARRDSTLRAPQGADGRATLPAPASIDVAASLHPRAQKRR